MMKVFISLPMNGKSDAEIERDMSKGRELLRYVYGDRFVFLDSYISDDPPSHVTGDEIPKWYLWRSLKILEKADLALLMPGWEDRQSCRIEKFVAEMNRITCVKVCDDGTLKVLPKRLTPLNKEDEEFLRAFLKPIGNFL